MKQEKVVPVNQDEKPEGERGTGSRDGLHQPREVQFLIERLCPHRMPDLIARYPQLRSIPFPLLVLADEQFNLSHPCSAKRVYKIDPKRAEQIRRAYGLPLSHVDRFVCEHMGRIIE